MMEKPELVWNRREQCMRAGSEEAAAARKEGRKEGRIVTGGGQAGGAGAKDRICDDRRVQWASGRSRLRNERTSPLADDTTRLPPQTDGQTDRQTDVSIVSFFSVPFALVAVSVSKISPFLTFLYMMHNCSLSIFFPVLVLPVPTLEAMVLLDPIQCGY
jgi:hypothetical protein